MRMDAFVIIFAAITVISGLLMLTLVVLTSIVSRNIKDISYSPLSENEAEYGLRILLFFYPNAVIHIPENDISLRFQAQNSRVIVHQDF